MSESKPYSGIPLDEKRTWIVPRWLKEVFVAFAVLAVGAVAVSKYLALSGGKLERAKSALEAIDAGGLARPFALPLRGGGTFDLTASRGKLRLINFWATWCPPCIEEMPSLARLAQAMDPQTFQLVAVSVDTSWPIVEKVLQDKPTPYTVVLDADAKVSRAYGSSKYPETYLVDADGNVKLKFIGPRDWSDARVLILLEQFGAKRLLGSSGPEPKAHSG